MVRSLPNRRDPFYVSPCAYVSPRLSLSSPRISLPHLPPLRVRLVNGIQRSRDIGRGIRTRLRSSEDCLLSRDKRRGVNFVYNPRLARIYGRKYRAREERRQESTKLAERIFWGVILPIWHFDVTLLSSYLSEWNELFLSSPRRHRTYIESIGVAEKNLSLSLSKVIETECVVHPASIVL